MNKNILTIIFCVLAYPCIAHSNDTIKTKHGVTSSIGIKVGENFEKMTGNFWKNKYTGSLCIGGIFEAVSGQLGLQVEVAYKMIKYSIKTPYGNSYVRSEYCDFPILVEYKLNNTLLLQAGCMISGLIFAKYNSVSGDKTNYKQHFNQLNIAPCAGMEIRMTPSFAGGVRYYYGITNNNKESVTKLSEQWNTRTLQLYLCYKFR